MRQRNKSQTSKGFEAFIGATLPTLGSSQCFSRRTAREAGLVVFDRESLGLELAGRLWQDKHSAVGLGLKRCEVPVGNRYHKPANQDATEDIDRIVSACGDCRNDHQHVQYNHWRSWQCKNQRYGPNRMKAGESYDLLGGFPGEGCSLSTSQSQKVDCWTDVPCQRFRAGGTHRRHKIEAHGRYDSADHKTKQKLAQTYIVAKAKPDQQKDRLRNCGEMDQEHYLRQQRICLSCQGDSLRVDSQPRTEGHQSSIGERPMACPQRIDQHGECPREGHENGQR